MEYINSSELCFRFIGVFVGESVVGDCSRSSFSFFLAKHPYGKEYSNKTEDYNCDPEDQSPDNDLVLDGWEIVSYGHLLCRFCGTLGVLSVDVVRGVYSHALAHGAQRDVESCS